MSASEAASERSDLHRAWDVIDQARAVVPADLHVLEAAAAARGLVVERLREHGRDLLHASAMLGRILADEEASTAFVAGTLGALALARNENAPAWLEGARAALLETYVAARLEKAQRASLAAWSYDACTVPLADGSAAMAAGAPDDDDESLQAWANGIAAEAARRRVRRVRLGGRGRAREALADALEVAGIAIEVPPAEPREDTMPSRRWLAWLRR